MFSLHPAWHALASRAAVASAALVALISLYEHAPVHVASLRGIAALLVVRFATRAGLRLLESALRADAEHAEQAAEEAEK